MTLSTPRFTWHMIRMSPRAFLIHSLSHIVVTLAPVGFMIVERTLFNELAWQSQWTSLWGFMAIYSALMIGKISATLGAAWGDVTFRYHVIGALQHNSLIGALRIPGAEPLGVSALEAINRLRDDVDEVADFPLWIPEVIANTLAAGGAFIVMCTIDVPLSLLMALPLILLGVVARRLWRGYLHYRYAAGAVDDRYSSQLGSIITAVQTLKLTASEDFALARLRNIGMERRHINVRGTAYANALTLVVNMGVALATGAVLWYGSRALITGAWGVGDLLLMLSGIGIIGWWPNIIATFIGDYAQQRVSITRLQAFVGDQPHELMRLRRWWQQGDEARFTQVTLPPLQELTFSDVRYTHDEHGHGIQGVNLQIPAGAVVAIVGQVGSGKSTLLNLCAGLLQPQQGEIHWNGVQIAQLGAPAVVGTTQVPFLLSDSLRFNITLGRTIDDATLQRAITASQLAQDIAQLPDGLDTIVGPRGVRLSGGQRQRVALARMLLSPADIVVLDDITSAVDSQTAAHLWHSIRQWAPHQTIIATSHRKAILEDADHIIVLENGRIVAQGTREHLLATNALFGALWQEMH